MFLEKSLIKKQLCEDLVFQKADCKKDENSSRKRLLVTGRREFSATPHFARDDPSIDKLRKVFDGLQIINHTQCIWDLIKSNGFKTSYFNQTSIKRFSNKQLNIECTGNFKEELKNKIFYKFDY